MGPLAAGLWAVGVVNWPDCRVASSVALDPRVLLAPRAFYPGARITTWPPMSTQTPTPTAPPHPRQASAHLVGRYGRSSSGPTVIVAGGLHGNEPSGVEALRRVFERLQSQRPPFQGQLVGLAGNLSALEQQERFLEEDLNRIWTPERVEALRQSGASFGSLEQREQHELLEVLTEVLVGANGEVYFLDLHTSSARGEPFVCIGDTLRNRAFAMQFPVPMILGLEEQIDGALLEYVNNLGHVTVGMEAGEHDHPHSVDHHEAFVLLALVAAGCLPESELQEADSLRAILRRAAGRLPAVMEVRYRHAITAGDGFQMQSGYTNFQPVAEGELLARSANGEIHARESGRVLLPLYQGLGSDGFFVVREVRPFWLRLSAALRHLGAGYIAHWLPGVHVSENPDTVVADHRVARWFVVEVFHLLGFRKRRVVGNKLYFSRRRERSWSHAAGSRRS